MMQIEEVYRELLQFLKTSNVEEQQFIFDLVKPQVSKTIVSLNGVYDLETMKSIISCLFIKGNDRLIDNLAGLLKDKKLVEREKEISANLKMLKKALNLKALNSKSINLTKLETITETEIRSSLEKSNADVIFKQIGNAPNIIEFLKMYVEHFKLELKLSESYIESSILRSLRNLKKKPFSLTAEFCDKHAENLYNKLYPKYVKCSKDDFMNFCHGFPTQKKINFKMQAELITLVKWLRGSGFFEQESISWVYVEDSCTIKNKSINTDRLRKNLNDTNSPNITSELRAFFANI